jgi:hypothetical protein
MDQAPPGFDAAATLETVRREREERRHRCTWGRSKLVRHRAELVALRRAGASLADLAHWLKAEKRLKADKSTIARYLATLPELRPDSEAPGQGAKDA